GIQAILPSVPHCVSRHAHYCRGGFGRWRYGGRTLFCCRNAHRARPAGAARRQASQFLRHVHGTSERRQDHGGLEQLRFPVAVSADWIDIDIKDWGNGKMHINSMRAGLERGEPQIGTWLTMVRNPAILSLMKSAGLDFARVDMEHTALTIEH